MNLLFSVSDTSAKRKLWDIGKKIVAERGGKLWDLTNIRSGGTVSYEDFKSTIQSIVSYSGPKDLYLVDMTEFSTIYFSLLLKVLEYPSLGDFWLIGSPSSIPATIRSRCFRSGGSAIIHDKDVKDGKALELEVAGYLEFMGKEVSSVSALLPIIVPLTETYSVELATGMAVMKSAFVDFLYMLDVANLGSFSVLMSFKDKLKGSAFFWLFMEWLSPEVNIFNRKELEVCSFLRDGKFLSHLLRFQGETVNDLLLPFVISYKVVTSKP